MNTTKDLDIPSDIEMQREVLRTIANTLDPEREYEEDSFEGYTLITFEFDSSPEGVTIAIESGKMCGPESHEDEYHYVINAWTYPSMTDEEADEMKYFVQKALNLLPEAVLVFQDDPYDFNPNSAVPEYHEGYNNYHMKTNDGDKWKENFEF